ncbi:MAG: NAD-binding protein [Planctomycetaceae bacterium]|nr:NAD-binding protein [Planctomycetaceae bacterium]
MKSLPVALQFITNPSRRRNLWALGKLLLVFVGMVFVFTVTFHYLMAREGQRHSWATGIYWVLVVMSTLGFGDITFHSDLGRLFSVVVLLSGSVFMLVLLPFMFIQFFYVPWMEAQAAARAPRQLPASLSGHVILTGLGLVEQALIRMLARAKIPYVVLVADLTEALRLHDEGYSVMLGDPVDHLTYGSARANQAALVVTAQRDTTNTNIAFTVREISSSVTIVATASTDASVDILELAGCNQVLKLAEMLGQALARRVLGRDARSLVVGQFGNLLIAEAAAAGTALVGRTLAELRLGEETGVTVAGVWDRGRFTIAGPRTRVEAASVLLLAGTRENLDRYDNRYRIDGITDGRVIIIGGGRVGRAVAAECGKRNISFRIIERLPERVRNPADYIVGDAAELETLQAAGIDACSSVVITTHDDDVNVYLAIYCRRLRPDVQILARANQDRNVSTLHRAGADFVMSYASTGASSIYDLLKRGNILFLAEGLDVFRVPVPPSLVGDSLAESQFRAKTGCTVLAIERAGDQVIDPGPDHRLASDESLIVVGGSESETKLFETLS